MCAVLLDRGQYERLWMLSVQTQVFVVSPFVFRVTHNCGYEFWSFFLQRNYSLLDHAIFLHKCDGFPGQFQNESALSVFVDYGPVRVGWRYALHWRRHQLLQPLRSLHFTHSGDARGWWQKKELYRFVQRQNSIV